MKINAATSAPPSQPRQRPLKVEDALAFLDEVKQRIPAAYNQLLDTMKEFKSGSIDTPDVIERVLHLFHGHRSVLLRFNIFLPPGYAIDFADDADTPRVTLPGGGQPNEVAITGERSCLQAAVDKLKRAQEEGRVIELESDDDDDDAEPSPPAPAPAVSPAPAPASSKRARLGGAAPEGLALVRLRLRCCFSSTAGLAVDYTRSLPGDTTLGAVRAMAAAWTGLASDPACFELRRLEGEGAGCLGRLHTLGPRGARQASRAAAHVSAAYPPHSQPAAYLPLCPALCEPQGGPGLCWARGRPANGRGLLAEPPGARRFSS